MMKKSLIVMLILGMTATSYAVTVTLHADATTPQNTTVYAECDGTVTVIVAGPAEDYQVYLDAYPGPCWDDELTDVVILEDAGDMSSVSDFVWYTEEGGFWEALLCGLTGPDPDPGEEQVAGDHFRTTFECLCVPDQECTVAELCGYHHPFPLIDRITVMCVPEPMALALLALGGLMLRRRK